MTDEELREVRHDDPRLTEMHRRIQAAREATTDGDAVWYLLDVVHELVNRSGTIDRTSWRKAQEKAEKAAR